MTGFGMGIAPIGSGRLLIEARAVNHRFLDVRARMPRELSEFGTFLEQLARAQLSRGRIELGVRYDGAGQGSVVIDRERALDVYRALDAVRRELGAVEPLPIAVLASIPDLFVSAFEGDPEGVRVALAAALEAAVASLNTMRSNEGANLAAELSRRLDALGVLIDDVNRRAPELPDRYRRRLRDRLTRLIEGHDVTLDPGRLEQEVVLFADHADVTEEIARLRSHTSQFAQLLSGKEPVGRRLEFLLQEMGREINTLGSKANEADIAQRVVEMKVEIEKMREQVQNVE
ncbi:MAG: YicC/YloC family endoribonuclease [Deltaproteobacteria bacterium]